MTPEERQALREKHQRLIQCEGCAGCHDEGSVSRAGGKPQCDWPGECTAAYYPCDVIKVLDELEGLINHFDEHYGMVYCFTCEKEL